MIRSVTAYVLRIAGERHPAERAGAFAEERPDVGRHEAGVVERVGHAKSNACWRRLLP